MIDDKEELKAQVEELIENLGFYLRNYNRLIASGFRKSVLDWEIEGVKEDIRRLNQRLLL